MLICFLGLSVHLKAECRDKLSLLIKQYIMSLLKDNMEESYGSDWPTEQKVKRREMVVPKARYIFVHEIPNECSYKTERERTYTSCIEDKDHMVGFVYYRFTLEEEIPILYVYELQLEPRVQVKGLGKFLMQLIELIAQKNRMGVVILIFQKTMNFYLNKLRYVISAVSPSRVDPLIGVEKCYEILCKTFGHEAKAILEAEVAYGTYLGVLVPTSMLLRSQVNDRVALAIKLHIAAIINGSYFVPNSSSVHQS
ncbi:N-alpha-acetyltransferase 40-like [Juglans regia]|uniref:N-alpha-acetyltransferase 40 n=1 Tax=Juglans regia TaxID=51240 RepID=A0A6P9EGQ5_JUGRE|nr:N-alpha-acetyltransferase 40-like [Juglans regia]